MAATTRSKTYRLPLALVDEIEKIRQEREEEIRRHLPAEMRDTDRVRVLEVDVVKDLLQLGLEEFRKRQQAERNR